MVIRHGTRYPGKDEIENMITYLPTIRDTLLFHAQEGKHYHNTI